MGNQSNKQPVEEGCQVIPTYYHVGNSWKAVKENGSKGVERSNIKVVTFNVWFESRGGKQRWEAILQILEKENADVICLQEVIPEFVTKYVLHAEWIQNKYWITDITGERVNPYGLLIISKIPPIIVKEYRLNTNMDRRCLFSLFKVNGELVSVSTVHLESLNTSETRETQLKQCKEILEKTLNNAPTRILVGDFNFDSDMNFSAHLDIKRSKDDPNYVIKPSNEKLENTSLKEILCDYEDIWELLKKEEKGYTVDSEVNEMVHNLIGHEQMRYDRVMFKSEGDKWKPETISLIGNQEILLGETEKEKMIQESVGLNLNILFPSDHFGLVFEMGRKK